MPQMGVSVAEGTIVEWRKQPGDWVEADETDLRRDDRQGRRRDPLAGQRPLGAHPGRSPGRPSRWATMLAEIDAAARPGEAHPAEHHDGRRAAQPAAAAGGRRPGRAADRPSRRRRAGPVAVLLAGGAADRRQARRRPRPGPGNRDRRPRAQEGRSRLRRVTRGRATRGCAEPALHTESPYQREEAEAPAGERGRDRGSRGASAQRPADGRRAGAERREPMTPMRQAIARHMVGSRRTAAHCTTIVEVDFSRVAARRRELREPMRAPRRQPHLPRVRRPGDGRGARGASACSTRRSTATRSSTTTTSTSGSRSPSRTA